MVAIRGPIMAAPLARPSSVTSRPAIVWRSETILGRVSVVMIAAAAVWKRLAARRESPATACVEPGLDPVHRKLVPDHAGRGDQDLLGPAAQQRRGARGRAPGVGQSLGAGRGVGVAGIDHDGADVLGGEPLAAPLHRRGTDPVGRERPGRRTGRSAASTARSSDPDALIPALTPLARKPRGMANVRRHS